MILDIHAVFLLLGKLNGELVKHVIELILFTLITYMTASEYTRDPRRELKYLLVAFATLSFQKLTATVVLASIVFGDLNSSAYTYYFNPLNHALEVIAIILLASAFLFPLLVKEYKSLKKNIEYQVAILALVYFTLQTIQLLEFFTGRPYSVIYWSNIIFNLMKITILLTSVYLLSTKTNRFYRYRYSIIIAFMVYLVDPLLKFIAYVFYQGNAPKLFVAAHPFPLLAVILFTRVMYLKLADKAYLKKQLAHEKVLGKLKDKFVSVISHELRTPLTSIGLYTSLLRDGKLGKITKKQKDAVKIVKDETIRLTELINDILDLSKLEDKKIQLKLSKFNLYDFAKNNAYNLLAKKKKIRIINEIPKNFTINVDKDKFTQVLINLISNAIKYTEKGTITIAAKKQNRHIEINIKDTGVGIAKQEISKIFNKFYQVEHYMTRKQGGSGLGLAIANEIVKAHKGKIEVKSEVGKGSVFSIIIPKNL